MMSHMNDMPGGRPWPPMAIPNWEDWLAADDVDITSPSASFVPDDKRGGYALICNGCGRECGFVTYDWIRAEEARPPVLKPPMFKMVEWLAPSHECPSIE